MSSSSAHVVGGNGHSNSSAVVVANIGVQGARFSGTFTGRTSYYAEDFVTSIYTDKDAKLYVLFVAGDSKMGIVRIDDRSIRIQLNESYPMGVISYDKESGDLSITTAEGQWFEGTLTGLYTTV